MCCFIKRRVSELIKGMGLKSDSENKQQTVDEDSLNVHDLMTLSLVLFCFVLFLGANL